MGAERTLVIGIGRFDADDRPDETPVGAPTWSDLPFVAEVVPQVAATPDRLGYTTDARMDPDSVALRSAVNDAQRLDTRTLFLLDLCRSGRTATLLHPDAPPRPAADGILPDPVGVHGTRGRLHRHRPTHPGFGTMCPIHRGCVGEGAP
ncbi:hypothetical protein [Embleya sp. MST-111070]|uniref:hypothetical protein n=1 Tax=Embleya sp. MST-111070 TaxID=3398231 RepID=UPI003F732395